MASVNKVILIGRLGDDPVSHVGPDKAVANFSVATGETWRDKGTGEKRERTEWHRCVVFGQQAQFAEDYLKKGSQVYIEGRLQTRKWTDKEGKEHTTTEVVADRLTALSTKKEKDESGEDIPY